HSRAGWNPSAHQALTCIVDSRYAGMTGWHQSLTIILSVALSLQSPLYMYKSFHTFYHDTYLTGDYALLLSGDAFGAAVADLLVDVAPIFQRTLQYGFAHAGFEVAYDVGYQAATLGIIHDLAHKRASLAIVVIVFVECVGRADELAIGGPVGDLGIPLAV